MNPRHLKRLFPNSSESFKRLNSDNIDDIGVSDKPKHVDRKEVCETQRGKKMDEQYKLCHVEMEYFASHGHKLDQDNSRYTIKVILDALVNLGFAKDDKEITSEVTQRFNEADINIP